MLLDLKWFILCLGFSPAVTLHDTADAKSPSGTYRGVVKSLQNGKQYLAFRGIRYATASRFQKGRKVKKSRVLQDATKDGNICPQINNGTTVGSEDCLFLNVYTPELNGKRPVLVIIHGGSWLTGSIEMDVRSPDFFMETGEVVIVPIQYRLGAFGFIDLSNKKYPSNLGLFDQRLALEWIKKNILSFGGDSDQITLLGNSAGAASVHLHLILANQTPGLFSRGIIQSGSIIARWGTFLKSETQYNLKQFLDATGCSNQNPSSSNHTFTSDDAAMCLLKLPYQDILKATAKIQTFVFLSPFGPVVEEEPIPEHPLFMPPVSLPFISGVNSHEIDTSIVEERKLIFLIPFIDILLPKGLIYDKSASNPQYVTQLIKDHYKWNNGKDFLRFISQVGSDCNFIFPNWETFTHSTGPTWNYYFDIRANNNGTQDVKGSKHADEMKYLFSNSKFNIRTNGSNTDVEISKSMVNLWINFARTGSGNIRGLEWSEYNSSGKVLMIKNEGLSIANDPATSIVPFWNGLPFRDKIIGPQN